MEKHFGELFKNISNDLLSFTASIWNTNIVIVIRF
jgi:hypothetical protein